MILNVYVYLKLVPSLFETSIKVTCYKASAIYIRIYIGR
jgi:hypothetical protein